MLSKLFKRSEKKTLSAKLFKRKRERERALEWEKKSEDEKLWLERMKKRNWVRKKWERVWEKETALRDKIPAALTLNTYYTCYAIDKFILYLYRDRIYDVLYVILYLYGLLHTLSPKLPFHRAAERTCEKRSTRKAQESKTEGGRKR